MPLISPAAVCLDEVAKAGSIRRAAARLNLSPSAVNRQILNLEAEYATDLFERLPRGVRLTAAGEVLVAEIRGWLNDDHKARRHLNELRGMVHGHASIGMMGSVSTRLVSRLMTFMHENHTQVSIDVKVGSTSEIIDQLTSGELDLAICYAVPKDSSIEVLSIHVPTTGVAVASDHPLATKKKVRLADCKDYTFVLPDTSLNYRRRLDKAFAAASFVPTNIVTTNSVEVMKMLVRDHGQIALISLPDVHNDVLAGRIVHIPLRDRFFEASELSLVAKRKVRLSPVATVLADYLRAIMSEFPES